MVLLQLVLLGLAGLGVSQNCPPLGAAYPAATDPDSPAFTAAKTAIDDVIAEGISSGALDNTTSFAIQVFSRHSDEALYEHYHGASTGPDTLYRVASISKLMTVYATLAALGDEHWHDPVTKHIPELARLKVQNPVYDVDWSAVTLGALASHMGGIPRDYSIGDLSTFLPSAPGLPVLNETEQVQCGNIGVRPCTREEAFEKIGRAFPIARSQYTPAYSNMAFQLLGYAVAKITGTPFPEVVEEKLLKPLGLARTFLSSPANDSNAVMVEGWEWDLSDQAPGAGYLTSPADLTALGRSILRSTLLPPHTTGAWLKPVAHTARQPLSIGRPWEIERLAIPVSPASNVTRTVDVYTKLGSMGGYRALIALSPDHGAGYGLLIGGEGAQGVYEYFVERLGAVWFAAAEVAAREEGERVYAGLYTLEDGSVAEVGVSADEAGLVLERLVSNGTDVMGLSGPAVGMPEGVDLGVWMYPMGLEGGGKVAFRLAFGGKGLPATDACSTWGNLDLIRYGEYPLDLVIFELGKDGKAVGIEVPILKKTLRRDGEACKRRK